MILEDLPWILVRTVPPLASPRTSSDRGGCKHRKLPSLQEYHLTTWQILLLPSSRHSQIPTMHEKFEKVVKIIYIVMDENHTVYNGSFRNCLKKMLLDILPGGLYRYMYMYSYTYSLFYRIFIVFHPMPFRHWQIVKFTKLYFNIDFFCSVVNSFERDLIFFVFTHLYCNPTPF